MRVLNVQVQPARSRSLDIEVVQRSLRALGARKPLVSSFWESAGWDDGRYINFNYRCTNRNLGQLWTTLRRGALGRSAFAKHLRAASIVVCQGSRGWDDYLLLHHFDRTVPLDRSDEL